MSNSGQGIGIPIEQSPGFGETPLFSLVEIHKPEDGDEVVYLLNEYLPNSDEIIIYKNGYILPPSSYTESGFKEITILESMSENDIIVVVFNEVGPTTSLPKQYGSEQRLENNHSYEFTLQIGDDIQNVSFSSRYTPFYSSNKNLRNSWSEWLTNVPDDIINYAIWDASVLAEEIAAEEFDTENPPNYVRQFVRYKAAISLIKSIYLGETKSLGLTKKVLATLTIERDKGLPALKDLLYALEGELSPWESLLLGGTYGKGAYSAVKAGSQYPFPLAPRRSF